MAGAGEQIMALLRLELILLLLTLSDVSRKGMETCAGQGQLSVSESLCFLVCLMVNLMELLIVLISLKKQCSCLCDPSQIIRMSSKKLL